MNNLTKLYNKITDEGIYLFNADTQGQKAVSIRYGDNYGIFFSYSSLSNSQEEFLVLSHEYGHCATGSLHALDSPFQLIAQHEVRATRKAIHEFLPAEILKKEIAKGYNNLWQLSERLNLPEPFVKLAIEAYRLEGEIS